MSAEVMNDPLEKEAKNEKWTAGDIKSDLHVIHFRPDAEGRFNAGDKGASQTITEIVNFAYENFPPDTMIVVGNHSLGYSELKGADKYTVVDVDPLEHQIKFLHDQKSSIQDAIIEAQANHPNAERINILFGVEADIYLDENGKPYLNPPEEALVATDAAPDLVIASFHKYADQIPIGVDKADKLYEGFMHAINSGVVHKFGHPLNELNIVRQTNPDYFDKIILAAKDRGIIFEVNTGPRMIGQLDNQEIQETLKSLIANGNLLDMGSDFHHFSMFKRSGLIPEGRDKVLSPEEIQLLENWTAEMNFGDDFKKFEDELWVEALADVNIEQIIELEGGEYALREILWRVYKGEVESKIKTELAVKEQDDIFAEQRDALVVQINGGELSEEDKTRISELISGLYKRYSTKPAHVSFNQRERIFTLTGLTLGDLKRMYGPARKLRKDLGLPRSQFVNVWTVENQRQHFEGLKERHEKLKAEQP